MSRTEDIFDFEEKPSLPNKIYLPHISSEAIDKRQTRSFYFNKKCEIKSRYALPVVKQSNSSTSNSTVV
jgi:hypothetical protein